MQITHFSPSITIKKEKKKKELGGHFENAMKIRKHQNKKLKLIKKGVHFIKHKSINID